MLHWATESKPSGILSGKMRITSPTLGKLDSAGSIKEIKWSGMNGLL